MKKILLFALLIITTSSNAQEINLAEVAKEITAEGKELYRLERTSWLGTDIALKTIPTEKIGGYFSYASDGQFTCVFFNREVRPEILATMQFDSTFSSETSKIDSKKREFTTYERDIYALRSKALLIMNTDTIFKTYDRMNLNIIPIINGNEHKAYVLTGPEENGVVIFGNDYLMNFDSANNLISLKVLHRNIIPMTFEDSDKEIMHTYHSHRGETSDFMTATDVCTLMLYAKYAKWKNHIVYSDKYVTLWNCERHTMMILTKEAYDRMYEKRK